MNKLVRTLLLLGVIAAAVALYAYSRGRHVAEERSVAAARQSQEPNQPRGEGMQVQEKYGFAPVGQ